MALSPVIFGFEGLVLTAEERALFADLRPAGFILFARNVETPTQVQALTDSLRECVGYEPLILIDQEGGRVQRLRPPHWRQYIPMDSFDKLLDQNAGKASRLLRLHSRMLASDLRALGINVNCLPLLDVPVKGGDAIIGDRALATDPDLVGALGRIVIDSHMETGVLPVIKHIPGHGRATVDSHKGLPVVDTKLKKLKETDFKPFKLLSDAPLAMTAHITYSDVDSENPATFSSIVVGRVIRMLIGYSGLLMSDDIGMHALSGSMKSRAEKSLKAGCDLVLHCGGDFKEMAEISPVIDDHRSDQLEAKVTHILKAVLEPQTYDRAALEDEYDLLLNSFQLKDD
ncbi:beta-N-acetylhexosaminidase [Temperatibacter marinus]|uniref:beta-N-acetylhexosaminidase n=1 Tax=Temperatibacter marinus TaxID=1456591 RepID=A0AA52EHJ0_9PROT|nr:beta-N-acetylhexosaminidase [Temperatibacter marinus]WND02629.1 beta-N-acetylhexosaminidase [Temperatibacter marinus]